MSIVVSERERSQPIHQWVYDELWTNIVQLHLDPGQNLSENEVAALLGVSRTPVREAFIRLAKDGLIEILPQKGSVVSLVNLGQARDARFVRSAVEKTVLREACTAFPKDVLTQLESLIQDQKVYLESGGYDRFLIADNEFHRTLYRGCGKERVWTEVIRKLDFNYDRLRIMALPFMSNRVIQEHKKMIDIISTRKIDSIEKTIEQHLTWEMINRAIAEQPARFFAMDEQEQDSGNRKSR